MLITKWLVTDSIGKSINKNIQSGLCLHFKKSGVDIKSLYKLIQKELYFIPFSILLSGDEFNMGEADEAYMDEIIRLLFLPSYYTIDHYPVLFLKNVTSACSHFIEELQKKCAKQGLKDLLIMEVATESHTDTVTTSFAYWLNDCDINYNLLLKNWLDQYLEKNNQPGIHLLVSDKGEELSETLSRISEKEKALAQSEIYKIANILYEKERIIEEYKWQLSLKAINEKNNQLYLSIQKAERANALSWYYHEYEVLPLWYKQLGHIVKVITGKRTFKSLFNDNVKKHKD